MRNTFWTVWAMSLLTACNQPKEKVTAIPINYDSIRIVLENMRDEDQEIRRILVDSIGYDSPNSGPFIRKMMDIDAENQTKIKLILDNYGWVEQSKIGIKASEAFFYTIQHSDIELMEKWFPEFKRLADSNEANRKHCAMMEDRILMWKGKKQIYGTQASDFRPDKKMAIWPIENPESVNERRKKIGFASTVEEYAKNMDAIFDINDILPEDKN